MRELDGVFLDEVERIARSAGEFVKAYYAGGARRVAPGFKSGRRAVTAADRESERLLQDALVKLHPCAFHGEECGGEIMACGDQWVVDPLDGTENMSGYPPLAGISVGLLRHGQPVLGVICDPIHGVLYSAAEGRPAMENGQAVRVSARAEPEKALIGLDFSSEMETRGDTLGQLACVLKRARAVKVLGVPALSLAAVGSGRLDLFFRPASKPADLAAGVCVVRAAGGSAVDFDGSDWTIRSKGILAGPKRMVEAYLPCLNRLEEGRPAASAGRAKSL